ncbi:MAG: peptidoglycan DD-metalloendopeptidase family protein [Bryobacteraceae bacterium]|nr:peptidoglycan DD-metalloendopeptidase family protein [Bryobacteraceae bacterium]
MRQQYFILVLAHSLHGRLRRIHVPHQFVYVVVALALFGSFSLFGMVSSYLRMAWKVSNYNTLRNEVETLRNRYKELQAENHQKQEQLASLQLLATEMTSAIGMRRRLEAIDLEPDTPLMPSFEESLENYNFLKSASYSRLHRTFAQKFHQNVTPSLWPVNGRLLSYFGARTDPFSGEGSYHSGVDIEAPTGTAVRAVADGIVAVAEYSRGYGRVIVVDHGNGMRSLYAHLSAANVIPGQEVRRGEVIAASGATGRVTAPHLHFEVRMGPVPVNPYPYLAKASTYTAGRRDLPF